MFSLDEIVEKICEHSGMNQKAVLKLIEEKEDELSGLVSKEGAAYIVAREYGISLLRESKRQLKVKSLAEGLTSVELVARVVRISEPRTFDKDGRKGSVLGMILGDETGTVRISLWNEELDIIADLGIKEGDVVKLTRGYVKMDNRGNLDLRVGKGKLEKVDEEVKLPEAHSMRSSFESPRRKLLSEVKEGDSVETRACFVQIFRKNPFFEVCPTCGVRAKNRDGKWFCDEHGEVKPAYQMVISGVLDDGFGNIRVTFFRELAERLFGKKAGELRAYSQEKLDPTAAFETVDLLGRDFIVSGRVKKNEMTENLEMIANDFSEIDVKKEFEMLAAELAR